MTKKTLEQIRAEVALQIDGKEIEGKNEGDRIKAFPTMVQINGLLSALAYAVENKKDKKSGEYKRKNEAEYKIAKAIIDYINELNKYGYSVTNNTKIKKPEDLIKFLCSCSPEKFRRINAEVMAFLNYFRRLAL